MSGGRSRRFDPVVETTPGSSGGSTGGSTADKRLRAAWLYYNRGLTQKEVADRLGISRPLCTSVCPRLPSRACARPERPRGGVARMGARGTAAATGLLGECLDLRRWRARAGASGSRQEILPVGIGNTGGRDRRSGARKDPPDRPVRVSRQALRRPGSRPLRADDPDPGAPVATRRGRPLLRPVAEAAA